MSLKYEPSSEPLHISAKELFLNCVPDSDQVKAASREHAQEVEPQTLNPEP